MLEKMYTTVMKSHCHPPCCAALAITTMSVTFGVSLAKNGIDIATRTHRQIFSTISGSCPQASPIPRSPIPCGQDKFSSNASAPAFYKRG